MVIITWIHEDNNNNNNSNSCLSVAIKSITSMI